jgi:hypothetical protein
MSGALLLLPIYSLVAWTENAFLILVPSLDMRGVWCFLELALLPPTYPVVPGLDVVGSLLISSPLHSTYRDCCTG